MELKTLTTRGLATFWLAKLLVHERAGHPARRAFVAVTPDTENRDYFIHCTRCVGFWAAILVLILPARIVNLFAVAAVNDLSQVSFRALCGFSNRCEL